MPEGQDIILKNSITAPKKDDLTDKAKDIMNMIIDLKPVLNTTLINVREITANLKSVTAGLKGGEHTVTSDKILALLDKVGPILDNLKKLTGSGKIEGVIDTLDATLKNVKNITSKDEVTMILLKENLIELKNTLKL